MRNLLSIFSFKNRNPLTAILLFLALVLALETVFAFLPQNSLVKSFRVSRIAPGPVPDIQIMGDSVAQGGILAEHLQQFVPDGTVVHNFAIAGTGPEFPYFVLKRQIDAGKAPKNIIYAPSPHTFASKRVALLVGAFCDWKEVAEVATARKETCEVIYGILCKLSYTLRHREQLGDILKGNTALFRKPSVKRTGQAGVTERHYSLEKLHPMYRKAFEVQPFNRHYYEKFLQLAQENGIQIYWVSMPVLPVVAESRRNVNYDAVYFDFLEEAQSRFGVKVLQKEFLVFEDQDFKDYTHLDTDAAARFTKIVGNKWATLPRPAPGESAKR